MIYKQHRKRRDPNPEFPIILLVRGDDTPTHTHTHPIAVWSCGSKSGV